MVYFCAQVLPSNEKDLHSWHLLLSLKDFQLVTATSVVVQRPSTNKHMVLSPYQKKCRQKPACGTELSVEQYKESRSMQATTLSEAASLFS